MKLRWSELKGQIRTLSQFSANGYRCLPLKPRAQHVQLEMLCGPPATSYFFNHAWLPRWRRKLPDSPGCSVFYHLVCVWAKEFKPRMSAVYTTAWGSGHLPQQIPCLVSMCSVAWQKANPTGHSRWQELKLSPSWNRPVASLMLRMSWINFPVPLSCVNKFFKKRNNQQQWNKNILWRPA